MGQADPAGHHHPAAAIARLHRHILNACASIRDGARLTLRIQLGKMAGAPTVIGPINVRRRDRNIDLHPFRPSAGVFNLRDMAARGLYKAADGSWRQADANTGIRLLYRLIDRERWTL